MSHIIEMCVEHTTTHYNCNTLHHTATATDVYVLCHISLRCVSCSVLQCVVWRIDMCVAVAVCCSCSVWYDALICVLQLQCVAVAVCGMTHWYVCCSCSVWYDALIRVTWCTYMCDVTQLQHTATATHVYASHHISLRCVSHDAFICVTWLTHTCDMTHPYVWHDAHICVTWPMHMFDMTQFRISHWYVITTATHCNTL